MEEEKKNGVWSSSYRSRRKVFPFHVITSSFRYLLVFISRTGEDYVRERLGKMVFSRLRFIGAIEISIGKNKVVAWKYESGYRGIGVYIERTYIRNLTGFRPSVNYQRDVIIVKTTRAHDVFPKVSFPLMTSQSWSPSNSIPIIWLGPPFLCGTWPIKTDRTVFWNLSINLSHGGRKPINWYKSDLHCDGGRGRTKSCRFPSGNLRSLRIELLCMVSNVDKILRGN